nr:MAG TPA: hypothetical protein [Caudoviricetes sp.]
MTSSSTSFSLLFAATLSVLEISYNIVLFNLFNS